MGSAGKWVLGLLLLVVGAVFVARAVSSDPESQATVKNNLQADPASVAKANAAADAAKAKKIAGTTAGDVSCKKACIEVNEVAADSITTAKLAPGSVTLSKLAFEVPNLNELENEINARKAAEASAKVAASDLSAATAKNDAAITVAASNGITAETAARTAADQDLTAKTAAADADLLSKLNTEVTNRGSADDVLQAKLNTEISDRAAFISGLRSELINPNQVGAPIVQINNNEIVGNAVSTDKILADTILANDLATGSVTTDEILDDTVAAVDLANGAVVGRAAGETLTNTKARTLRGERNDNTGTGVSAGDIAVGTITGNRVPNASAAAANGNLALETVTGESDNTLRVLGAAVGNLGLKTVGRNNLVNDAIDNTKIEDDAVTTNKIGAGEVQTSDIKDLNVTTAKLEGSNVNALTTAITRAVTAATLADGAVINRALGANSITTDKIASGEVKNSDLDTDAVTTDKIGAGEVQNSDIKGDAVTTDKIGAGEVQTSDIKDRNVTTSKLAGTELNDTDLLQVRAVTAATLADNAVINRTLADNAVTGAKILNLTITAADLIGTDKANTAAGEVRAVSATALADGAVTNRAVTDGALAIAKLDTDIATQSELDAATTGANSPLNTFKRELGNTGTFDEGTGGGTNTPDENGDPVSFFKIKDLTTGADGNITGAFVKNGSLHDADIADLAGSKVTGAVASATAAGTATTAGTAATATDLSCASGCVGASELAADAVVGHALGGASNVTVGSIAGQGTGVIGATGDIRLGTITGQVAPAAGTPTGNIALGTIGTTNLADGAVTVAKLGSDTVTRFTAIEGRATVLEGRATALEQQFTDLANPSLTLPAVSSKHLAGDNVTLVDPIASTPAPVAIDGIATVALIVPGIGAEDIFTVTPPVDLGDGVIVQRADVTGVDTITVTLYNASAAAKTVPTVLAGPKWKVRWIDL